MGGICCTTEMIELLESVLSRFDASIYLQLGRFLFIYLFLKYLVGFIRMFLARIDSV